MARLEWSAAGERYYDNGVDRGVLYVDMGNGVAWTGLISVSETPTGGEPRPYYLDGLKYLNIASSEEFAATITAFSSPPEFAPCDGVAAIQNGLFATQQPRKAFNMSYRTMLGSDADRNAGYKIHLIYNALVAPSEVTNTTMGAENSPNQYSWGVTTLPPSLTGRKPTAHFVIDSRYTPKALLANIEDILYGTDEQIARIPMVSELVALFQTQGPEVRRNYALDPRITVPANWVGLDANKGVTTTATYGPNIPAVEGEVWTISFDATATGGNDVDFDVVARPTTDSAFGANTYSPTSYSLFTGQSTRVSDTTIIPAGANGFRPAIQGSTLVDGTLQIDNLLIEKTSVAGAYFDGDTFDENGNFYSWVGDPNNSESIVNSWN